MAGIKAKGGKKNRKVGRNAKYCERYRAEGRWLKNKLRRLRSHLKRQPNDRQALKALEAAK